jgi:hypothetical protein
MSAKFFDAIKQGNKNEVERRLMLDPVLIHVKENGLSPIMVAAHHHEPVIASFLADKTVAINIFEAALQQDQQYHSVNVTRYWSAPMQKISNLWVWRVFSVISIQQNILLKPARKSMRTPTTNLGRRQSTLLWQADIARSSRCFWSIVPTPISVNRMVILHSMPPKTAMKRRSVPCSSAVLTCC